MPPAWLEDWLRLPMQPLVSAGDVESRVSPQIREIAMRILACPGGSEPFGFRYHGGSDPGMARSVLPVLLFRKIGPGASAPFHESRDGVAASPPIYLLARCLSRGAVRTFRLDRIEFL